MHVAERESEENSARSLQFQAFLNKLEYLSLVKLLKNQLHNMMLNKLKNFRSLGPDAIPVYLAPKGNQANISLGVVCFIILPAAREV